jgi:hypothetical protein
MVNSPVSPAFAVGSFVRIAGPAAVLDIVNPRRVATHEVRSEPDAEGYVQICPILERWLQVRAVAREVEIRAARGEAAPTPRASRIKPERLIAAD